MEIKAGHYYECLSPPMKNFSKGKDYEVFIDERGNLAVQPDGEKPLTASIWIDERNFKDVTHHYTKEPVMCELLPLTWQKVKDEFWCSGLNHTYVIFDSDEGIGVRWHDLHNDSNDRRYGFTGVKDAMEWVEYTHHPAQIKPWVRFIKGFRHEPTKEVSDSVPTEP